jgi:hypothetical protein
LSDADITFAPNAPGFEQINRQSGAQLENDLGYRMPSMQQRISDQINVARQKRQMPSLSNNV